MRAGRCAPWDGVNDDAPAGILAADGFGFRHTSHAGGGIAGVSTPFDIAISTRSFHEEDDEWEEEEEGPLPKIATPLAWMRTPHQLRPYIPERRPIHA